MARVTEKGFSLKTFLAAARVVIRRDRGHDWFVLEGIVGYGTADMA